MKAPARCSPVKVCRAVSSAVSALDVRWQLPLPLWSETQQAGAQAGAGALSIQGPQSPSSQCSVTGGEPGCLDRSGEGWAPSGWLLPTARRRPCYPCTVSEPMEGQDGWEPAQHPKPRTEVRGLPEARADFGGGASCLFPAGPGLTSVEWIHPGSLSANLGSGVRGPCFPGASLIPTPLTSKRCADPALPGVQQLVLSGEDKGGDCPSPRPCSGIWASSQLKSQAQHPVA